MAIDALERLGAIEHRLISLEQRLGAEVASIRVEMGTMATRGDISELRRRMDTQFYWILTFVLGSILVPILRDLAR